MEIKLIYAEQTRTTHVNYGGKANNLIEIKKNGIKVPDFLIIPSNYLENLLPETLQDKSDFISQFVFPDSLLDQIMTYFNQSEYVAVRSSALNEDGNKNSFAGQYESKLFVDRSHLNEAIITVWKSLYSDRVMVYQKNNHLESSGMAILIQKMIDADVSGVGFSINPLTGTTDETVINAVYGLGEGVVSGELNADLFIKNQISIKKEIAEKSNSIKFNLESKNGTKCYPLPEEKINKACLNDDQIIEISSILSQLSVYFKHPQDVEFAYESGQLFILQTRPITTFKKTELKDEKYTIWDNSNIIESYPDLTLPLTFSFIEKMYEAVYKQLSFILGVSKEKIEENREVYANMLGLLYGRVYYNLNNWHKSLSLLPGYKLNAEFMDTMMGVKEKFDTKIEPSQNKLKEYFHVISALFKILKQHNSLNKDRIAFQRYFNEVMFEFESMNFEKMELSELLSKYELLENTLVKKWKAPLVNDFFCMIYFGVLQKLVAKYNLDENNTLHNDLVSSSKDIISTEPITMTMSIVNLINNSEEAKNLFEEKTATEILIKIKEHRFSDIHLAIQKYIQKWGERCVGELKLETITYKQQPENYIKILQNFVKNKTDKTIHSGNHLRSEAEQNIENKLNGKPLKKIIFSYVLIKARYLISNRENLRFERTRAFGMVRILMMEIGRKLSQKKIIDNERDVFYLTQDEVFNYIKHIEPKLNLKTLIEDRKTDYKNYKKNYLPERIKTNQPIEELEFNHEIEENNSELNTLKGIGCCKGIVRGRATVIHSPQEIENLNNTILITASTDPGWVVLFPSASAIVVERGSLLSHSAIVSREMGIPCIVGVKNLLKHIKTGDLIEINGSNGIVKILERA
jgi:phosphohistidine swiveling domain-containing protein